MRKLFFALTELQSDNTASHLPKASWFWWARMGTERRMRCEGKKLYYLCMYSGVQHTSTISRDTSTLIRVSVCLKKLSEKSLVLFFLINDDSEMKLLFHLVENWAWCTVLLMVWALWVFPDRVEYLRVPCTAPWETWPESTHGVMLREREKSKSCLR